MKKVVSLLLVVMMFLTVTTVAVTAEGSFAVSEDGYVVGTYSAPGSYIEVVGNGKGIIVGNDSVDVKFPAIIGTNVVEVYVDGALVDTYEVSQAAVAPDPVVEPTDEPTDEPTNEPTDEPTDEPSVEPSDEPTDEPSGEPSDDPNAGAAQVTISDDGKNAYVTGDYGMFLARVALILDMDGESGLYVTQCVINETEDGGLIVIPEFILDGLDVIGVNVALVKTVDDVVSPTPDWLSFDVLMF